MIDDQSVNRVEQDAYSSIDSVVSTSNHISTSTRAAILPEFAPVGYSILAKDLLSGTSARDLRRNNAASKYSAAAINIDDIGGNWDQHLRGNHSLLDRLENVNDVLLQLTQDYGIDKYGDLSESNLKEYDAESLLNELSQLENQLRKFDISSSRLRKVKNSNKVRARRAEMLRSIYETKSAVFNLYGIEMPTIDPTKKLIDDILAGKSASYLQNEYSVFDIKKNHAWSDRIDNVRNILYKDISFDGSKDRNYIRSAQSEQRSKQISMLIDSVQTSLEGSVPKSYRDAASKKSQTLSDSQMNTLVNYQLTTTMFDQVREELEFAQNQIKDVFKYGMERIPIVKVDSLDLIPMRYVGHKEAWGKSRPTEIFDLRKPDDLTSYMRQYPQDRSVQPFSKKLKSDEALNEVYMILNQIGNRSQAQVGPKPLALPITVGPAPPIDPVLVIVEGVDCRAEETGPSIFPEPSSLESILSPTLVMVKEERFSLKEFFQSAASYFGLKIFA